MTHQPSKIVSETRVFKGFLSLDVVKAAPPSLRGEGHAPEISREVLRVGDVAGVLLYDPKRDEILLNQQFRMGALMAGATDPCLFELVGGLVDAGETPAEAARREAVEEAGCTVTELEPVAVCYSSPGCLDEVFHLFIGRVDAPRAGLHGLETEGEEIRTHLFPADKVIDMADQGLIPHGMTLLCINWLARHRARLRQKWGVSA